MGKVTIRTGLTSQGSLSMNPWKGDRSIYEFCTINKGNNFISLLEIVSSLNVFNIAHWQYHYYYINCTEKYNPKVYLSAIQSVSYQWNYDTQTGQTNPLPNPAFDPQKSGSCFMKLLYIRYASDKLINVRKG